MKIAFFDTKEYYVESFDSLVKENHIEIKYFKPELNNDTVGLTRGFDGVCVSVNDQISKEVINQL